MARWFLILFIIILGGCFNNTSQPTNEAPHSTVANTSAVCLSLEEANRLSALPLKCIQNEYPNKLNQTLHNAQEMGSPSQLHPAFYGCFDWHSSVHGHWMLVHLLKKFPSLNHRELIISRLTENLSPTNIQQEVAYFMRPSEKSFERTYGWAWLLKLAEELHTWQDPLGQELYQNLLPLTKLIVDKYLEFLPRLHYPIRVGEHNNTAFGLTFAWDFANTCGHPELKTLIKQRAREFYQQDTDCPLKWEPSGFDFLSPCFEEIDLMRRVLDAEEFQSWIQGFLPQLPKADFSLQPGFVSDRQDGKLVHIDGLNFSRAWCLYELAHQYPEFGHLKIIADEHIVYSLPSITDGSYEGEHWLASFAVYALSKVHTTP
jgi:hypothetical protein